MAPRPHGAKNYLVRLAAVAALLLTTTVACPAQSIGERAFTGEGSRADRSFDQRLAAAQQQLALVDDRIARLPGEGPARLTSFVLGNLFFVLVHELGHAVISQLNLPVLGREEDAADSFAALSMLFIGTDLSHTVLRDAVRGLWLTAHRDKSSDQRPALYDEHSLDVQRAYQIVCLMVGSDPASFKDVAAIAKLPPERQETCGFDFEQAARSWESLLQERSAAVSTPRSFIRRLLGRKADTDARLVVKYDQAESMSGFRNVLQEAAVLETVARFARESLTLPKPMTIKAMKCDHPNAYWDDEQREIILCYELVREFIELGLKTPNQQGSMP